MRLPITPEDLETLKKRKNNRVGGAYGKPANDKYLDKCYKELTEEQMEEILENKDYHWESYTYGPYLKNKKGTKEAVEHFIRGYLQYYDEVTRNGCIDHVVFFKWGKKRLDVHICPKPLKGRGSDQCAPPGAGLSSGSDPVPPKIPPPPPPGG